MNVYIYNENTIFFKVEVLYMYVGCDTYFFRHLTQLQP